MKKISKKYIDYSLGFPVLFLNAPLIKVRNQWTLHVNYNLYQKSVLHILAHKKTRLTGSEIQFIRKFFDMTIRSFADRFSVTHPAVIRWESKGDATTEMTWSTEKDIRLFLSDSLKEQASEIVKLYRSLTQIAKPSSDPIIIDGQALAA